MDGRRLVGSTYVHQSWPIAEGTVVLELRTTRVLLDHEYTELGKVIGELERLAEMLGVNRADFPPPEAGI